MTCKIVGFYQFPSHVQPVCTEQAVQLIVPLSLSDMPIDRAPVSSFTESSQRLILIQERYILLVLVIGVGLSCTCDSNEL